MVGVITDKEEICLINGKKRVRNFKSGIVERYCNGHKYAGGSGSLSFLNVAVPERSIKPV